jgi:hypothetical protein
MIKDLLALSDTVELMQSTDYRDRFVAEYIQTALRYERLKEFNTMIEAAEQWMYSDDMIDHDCPLELLQKQQKAMGEYLHVLELRAKIEDIDLSDVIACLVANKQTCCANKRCWCEEGIYGDTEGKSEPLKADTEKTHDPRLEGCPVQIGDRVYSILKNEEKEVQLRLWIVNGVAYYDGKYLAYNEEGETFEADSSMCFKADDIEEAKRKYLETNI